MFQGPSPITKGMKEEYERYRCREQQLGVLRPELSDVCKKYVFMINADIQEMAMGECNIARFGVFFFFFFFLFLFLFCFL